MANHVDQSCPLCGTPAEYDWVDSGNRKYFKCPKCTYFQVSKRAEEILAEQTQERRYRYAREAPQAPAEHLLTILMPDAEVRRRSHDLLQAEFAPKSHLPLNG
jgi:tRNA(Ile2) C34 agmatinyltransferase TiaS